MFQKILEESIAGNNVGIILRDVQRNNIQHGMIVAKPGTVKSHIGFEAQVYILQKEEGGCHFPFFFEILSPILYSYYCCN
jgi:elongation factor Tu